MSDRASTQTEVPASGHQELRAGWTPVEHEELPEPTYWPAALAFGITLLVWGLITSWMISAAGALFFIVGLAGWIGELGHDDEE